MDGGRERCVYVGQREMAVASAEDAAGVELLGSEDATTCHVVVLRDAAAGVTGLAHIDSDEPGQFLALERAVRDRSGLVADRQTDMLAIVRSNIANYRLLVWPQRAWHLYNTM